MIKKIIYAMVIFIITVTVFSGCNEKKDEPNALLFNVGYEKKLSGNEIPIQSFSRMATSLESLIQISDENGYPFFKENDTNYSFELCQKIREYDNLYFQEKALILVFYFESSDDYPLKVDSVYIENDALKVTLAKPVTEFVNDTETLYVFIIELNKKDVEGANKVEVAKIVKGQMEDY